MDAWRRVRLRFLSSSELPGLVSTWNIGIILSSSYKAVERAENEGRLQVIKWLQTIENELDGSKRWGNTIVFVG